MEELMTTFRSLIFSAALCICSTFHFADAQRNPCLLQERNFARAQSNLERAQFLVVNQFERLSRLQEQHDFQRQGFAAQLADAEARLSIAQAQNGGQTVGCGLSFLFNRNPGCFIGAVQANTARRRSAEAFVRNVRVRIQNFEILAVNQIQRQHQRIVFEQQRAAVAQEQYNQAVGAYNSCAATVTAF
jgi:hypothetical protein